MSKYIVGKGAIVNANKSMFGKLSEIIFFKITSPITIRGTFVINYSKFLFNYKETRRKLAPKTECD